jgi:hypothetical protein
MRFFESRRRLFREQNYIIEADEDGLFFFLEDANFFNNIMNMENMEIVNNGVGAGSSATINVIALAFVPVYRSVAIMDMWKGTSTVMFYSGMYPLLRFQRLK